MERESMQFDVVIVGAGPAGLSAAIRLKQLAQKNSRDISVCVLEKGAEVGAHLLSGAVLNTAALEELVPDWQERGAPVKVKAVKDKFIFLTKKFALRLMTPPQMHNKRNYIISISLFGRWLAEQAAEMGVEIYPGFAAAEVLYHSDGSIKGVATGDMGVTKDGEKGENYTPGVEIHARQTVFAEGSRGSLSQGVIKKFALDKDSDPQTYGLGVKEIWDVTGNKHYKQGLVVHTVGWPLDSKTYGGSFMYHMDKNKLAIGFVVGLDYQNPYLSPYEEMQRFKTHPAIRKYLEGGRRLEYGARSLTEGGTQSMPELAFPGGVLVGDAAGMLNVPQIKGTHNAMKSGMIAAESIFEYLVLDNDDVKPVTAKSYPATFKKSWAYRNLYNARNIRPSFKWGLWFGLLFSTLDTFLFFGKAPWTFKNHADHKQLVPKEKAKKIDYPKPDNVLTFDRLSSVALSNTAHEENQPCHLTLKDDTIPVSVNLEIYDAPEQRYCPAGVYEIVEENGKPRLQINASNCVHCKTCDIKDPTQNIKWVVPEGGGGPNYSEM